jgi:hemerythrin-like domain-containing protein
MNDLKPIKRSKELVSLSRDHHDGLLLCWKISMGLDKSVAISRIRAYILYTFDNDLDEHFKQEEEHLFPLLPADNELRREAEMHHAALREMITGFRSSEQVPALSLKYFAEVLKNHIRFEERVLFNFIEKEVSQTSLVSAGTKLNSHPDCKTEWADQFWVK